ncbi:MAG: Nif3-like dinuclear metal center hexameric protein [Flavobacteriales bacterium TMED123]|nr:MAG: Nif3-like dinuclear metal center hexameric protein [Flavobacteriales bacterium TMED123]|tara:strand:+ start:4291 stop:5385 length:1095 start_codon:yes stop_codon:yes gene_type:complete
MKIKEITNYLESIAPLHFQEDYDNSGLLVGNENSIVDAALITLDCTEEVVQEAIALGCNLIIAHHPIIFSGLKKLAGNNYVERTIIQAIKNDIAIYAIHTNLDNVGNGVSAKIAEKLGVENCKILSPKKDLLRQLAVYCPSSDAEKVRNKLFKVGAGDIGNYDECSFTSVGEGTFKANEGCNPHLGEIGERHQEKEERIEVIFPKHKEQAIITAIKDAHPYEEIAYQIYILDNVYENIGSGVVGKLSKSMASAAFLELLKSTMKTDCVRYSKLVKNKIETVAICGGSGSFLLSNAKSAKADILITADFKYHEFFDADDDIIIADIGHYESEQFTKDLIYDLLIKKFSKFAVQLSKVNTNPIKYF